MSNQILTILIVDDSASTRALISSTISQIAEFDIIECTSGFDALRVLPRMRPDLILTDINMPDINGLELISTLKNNPNYKDIPLIIISTESSTGDKNRGIALGAVGYVVKPFEPSELQALVKKYLG